MRREQRGVSLLFVGVMLILIVGAILAFLALFGTSHQAGSLADTAARLAKARDAIDQFAAATGRLPCPTDPTASTGDEDRTGGSSTCNKPTGTLPWRTIGLRPDDGLDSWGWKISYRVYTGAGSLTQDGGASMVQCDTSVSTDPGLDANGLCQVDGSGWHTLYSDFYGTKGLKVTDFGTVTTGVAYVLVSAGPTGYGSYTATGVATTAAVSTDEVGNTLATGQGGSGFVARAASAGVAASDATHFDDVLAYRTISDLATKSGLVARDWPDGTAAASSSIVLNTANISAALGHAASPGNLGTGTLTLGDATITVRHGSTAESLTLGSNAGADGVGGVSGFGGSTLSSARSEVLHLDLSATYQNFAITVNGFGCRTSGGVCVDEDRMRLTFYKDGTTVSGPLTKLACNAGSGLASYTINVGTDFNGVDIAPRSSTPSATTVAFYVSAFNTCASTACTTDLDTGSGPGGNHCP